MREFFEILGCVVLVMLALFTVLATGFNADGSYQCSNYQDVTGKETKYFWFDSCYINTASGWQRYDEYKARIIASEGLSNNAEKQQ